MRKWIMMVLGVAAQNVQAQPAPAPHKANATLGVSVTVVDDSRTAPATSVSTRSAK